MKHLLTAIAIITLFTNQSCNEGKAETKKEVHQRIKADTTLTFCLVMADPEKEVIQSIHVMRIIKDTFAISKVDTVEDKLIAKQDWRIDTLYFYPSREQVKINNAVIKGKDGKDSLKLFYRLMPRGLILQDFNKRFR